MGDVTISIANVDLVYLALQVVLTSAETARGMILDPFEKPAAPVWMAMGTKVSAGERIQEEQGAIGNIDRFSQSDGAKES